MGGSNAHVNINIFASLNSFPIYGCDISLSNTIPYINYVSSIDPPTFEAIFIKSKFTSFLSKSATSNTASLAISANYLLYLLTTLLPNDVIAASTNLS